MCLNPVSVLLPGSQGAGLIPPLVPNIPKARFGIFLREALDTTSPKGEYSEAAGGGIRAHKGESLSMVDGLVEVCGLCSL